MNKELLDHCEYLTKDSVFLFRCVRSNRVIKFFYVPSKRAVVLCGFANKVTPFSDSSSLIALGSETNYSAGKGGTVVGKNGAQLLDRYEVRYSDFKDALHLAYSLYAFTHPKNPMIPPRPKLRRGFLKRLSCKIGLTLAG